MRTVSVVLDIQTQALDSSYTYVVPEEMDDIAVGCAVLVEFGRRRAVGYVMEIAEESFDLEGNVDFSDLATRPGGTPCRRLGFLEAQTRARRAVRAVFRRRRRSAY